MEWLKTFRQEQQEVKIVYKGSEEEKDGDVANRIWRSEQTLKCLIGEDRKRIHAQLWSGTVS